MSKQPRYQRKSPPPKPHNPTYGAQITRINELSKTARATWLSLLGYLAFVGVTLLGVQDADFFVASRQTQLPLINVSIPTRQFFIFAPLLGTALYAYLHFHLMKLWHALREPPAEVSGRPLSDHLTPWLINDMGLLFRFDGAARNYGLQLWSALVTILLVFFAGPLVIGAFWWRYWPAHEWHNTAIIGAALAIALYIMFASLNGITTRLRLSRYPLQIGMNIVQFAALLFVVSLVGVMKSENLRTVENTTPEEYTFLSYPAPLWLQNIAKDPSLSLARANLAEVELIPKPANWQAYDDHKASFRKSWCRDEGLKPEVCGPVPDLYNAPPPQQKAAREKWRKGFDLGEPDTVKFFAALNTRFEKDWKTEYRSKIAALPNLNLQGKDLRNANAHLAFFPGADLRGAELSGANLWRAELQGADLSSAKLQNAIFWGAKLHGSSLGSASMQNTKLDGAKLKMANLGWAKMNGAILTGAKLQGAYLGHTNLQEANLRNAQMQGANLEAARMQGAYLGSTQMQSTIWAGAILGFSYAYATNFTDAISLTQTMLKNIIGDSETLLPNSFAPDTSQPFYVWSCWDPANLPPNLEHMFKTNTLFGSTEKLRAQWVCSDKNPRRKTGTPTALKPAP